MSDYLEAADESEDKNNMELADYLAKQIGGFGTIPRSAFESFVNLYTSRILASQQAAHDAEIAELRKEIAYAERCALAQTEHAKTALEQLSAANAACAMKDAALKEVADSEFEVSERGADRLIAKCRIAISATSQQVAEWERKQLEPLRAQVAILRGSLTGLLNSPIDIGCAQTARETLANTQASAEQFIAECEQRGAVKALEEAADCLPENDCYCAVSLHEIAAKLRATSKKAG